MCLAETKNKMQKKNELGIAYLKPYLFLKSYVLVLLFMYMYLCECISCVWVPVEARRGSESLQVLDLQVVSHPVWMLGTELRSCNGLGIVLSRDKR